MHRKKVQKKVKVIHNDESLIPCKKHPLPPDFCQNSHSYARLEQQSLVHLDNMEKYMFHLVMLFKRTKLNQYLVLRRSSLICS